MANKGKKVKVASFIGLQRLFAGVAMLALLVTIVAGLRAEVRFTVIAYRAMGVMFLVFVVSRVVIRVLASYEEMNSGKA